MYLFIYLFVFTSKTEAYSRHNTKNSYKTLVRKPHWRKLLLAPTEVNAERGFKKYHLKEAPGFIWLVTGIAATKEHGEELRHILNEIYDTILLSS
jgi:hypothetical protein